MKHIICLAMVIFACATSLFAQDNSMLPTKAELLAAIETFSKSPLSAEGKAAGDNLLHFFGNPKGTNYADVRMFPELGPGIEKDQPEAAKQAIRTLRKASLAGNLKPQLETGVVGNQPYAGVQQMLKTYAQLKKADTSLNLPNLEKFAQLESKGQLKRFVDDTAAKWTRRKNERRGEETPDETFQAATQTSPALPCLSVASSFYGF